MYHADSYLKLNGKKGLSALSMAIQRLSKADRLYATTTVVLRSNVVPVMKMKGEMEDKAGRLM